MSNPFEKPSTPKNSWQLLQWLIFEPVLLERYEKILNKSQIDNIFFKSIIFNFLILIIPLTLVIYLISVVIIAGFDLPLLFPPDVPTPIDTKELFIQQWQTYTTLWDKACFFVSFDDYRSLKDLAIGLAFCLAFSIFFI